MWGCGCGYGCVILTSLDTVLTIAVIRRFRTISSSMYMHTPMYISSFILPPSNVSSYSAVFSNICMWLVIMDL